MTSTKTSWTQFQASERSRNSSRFPERNHPRVTRAKQEKCPARKPDERKKNWTFFHDRNVSLHWRKWYKICCPQMVSLKRLETSELCRLNLVFKLGYDDVYLQIYCYFFASKNVRYPSKFNRKKQREIKINSPEFEILGRAIVNAKDIDVPDAFITKPQLLTWLLHQ